MREDLQACQAAADTLSPRERRGLYSLLARVLSICEECERDAKAKREMRALFDALPPEGNRKWLFSSSDTYLMVCRYVFHKNRNAAWRHANCLREAAKRGVTFGSFAEYVSTHGGLNALGARGGNPLCCPKCGHNLKALVQ
jgi:hypothetical protein